jgi:hypothetical protein
MQPMTAGRRIDLLPQLISGFPEKPHCESQGELGRRLTMCQADSICPAVIRSPAEDT